MRQECVVPHCRYFLLCHGERVGIICSLVSPGFLEDPTFSRKLKSSCWSWIIGEAGDVEASMSVV